MEETPKRKRGRPPKIKETQITESLAEPIGEPLEIYSHNIPEEKERLSPPPQEKEQSSQTSKETYFQKEIKSTGKSLSIIVKHFIIILFFIALGVLMHYLLRNVFDNPKFFDHIPVYWVVDLADIAIIITFVIVVIRELWRLGNDD